VLSIPAAEPLGSEAAGAADRRPQRHVRISGWSIWRSRAWTVRKSWARSSSARIGPDFKLVLTKDK